MPISNRLSQIAKQEVVVNPRAGETLEQAEARVMEEHPDVFGGTQTATDFGSDVATESVGNDIKFPDEILKLRDLIEKLPIGSKEQKAVKEMYEFARDDFLKLHPELKANNGGNAKLLSSDVEDISAMKDAKQQLMNLLEFKNSAYGGKGIDTGPIVGGKVPIPFVSDENEPNIIPSGVSEFMNKYVLGEGENSGDRGEFRRKVLAFMTPIRKEATGQSAATKEIRDYILPMSPNESDNDITFFNKGLSTLPEIQRRLLNRIETAKQAGKDVSGFESELQVKPDDVVNQLLDILTKNQSGSFSREFPDRTKSFLASKIKQQAASPATFDPNAYIKSKRAP